MLVGCGFHSFHRHDLIKTYPGVARHRWQVDLNLVQVETHQRSKLYVEVFPFSIDKVGLLLWIGYHWDGWKGIQYCD